MEPSPPDAAAVLSVRIVSIDYYMAPPIPDLDFCYSPLFERNVEEVPVIRIYGSTPVGQKTCLHIHRALPYLYIPCPCELFSNQEEGDGFAKNVATSIEMAFENRGTSSPKRQHVHGFSLVRAKNFYGYHSTEDLFLKIYLYYPHEVARAASLLLVLIEASSVANIKLTLVDYKTGPGSVLVEYVEGGAVLGEAFQPFESHIPYLLQFLVDYNLFGMSHIHTSSTKFRLPLPDSLTYKVANQKKHDKEAITCQGYSGVNGTENSAIWLSSTVSSVMVWPDLTTIQGSSENVSSHLVRRHSNCELEADSNVDDILNEKNKLYTSFSQTKTYIKMVQSLLPIWEEYERSGMQELTKVPDLSKPAPENILRNFIQGADHGLLEVFTERPQCVPPDFSGAEKDEKGEDIILLARSGQKLTFAEPQEISHPLDDHLNYHKAAVKGIHHGLTEAIDHKNSSNQALGLLTWFASSEAVEDINSDDELVQEAILTPLVSPASYKKALKMAQLDYEHASQQECQDILDSIDYESKSDELKEQNASSRHLIDPVSQSDGTIPQFDESSDGGPSDIKVDPFGMNKNNRGGKQSTEEINKRNIWGPLPFSTNTKEQGDLDLISFASPENEVKNDTCSSSLRSEGEIFDASKMSRTAEAFDMPGVSLASCSVRDLMRRKRHFKGEFEKYQESFVKSPADVANIEQRSLSSGGSLCFLGPDTSERRSCPEIPGTVLSMATCMQDLFSYTVSNKKTQDGENPQKASSDTHMSTRGKSSSVTNISSLQKIDFGIDGCNIENSLSYTGSKMCMVEHVHNPWLENIEMKYSRKLPSNDEILSMIDDPSGNLLESDQLLPFFDLNQDELQAVRENLNFHEEAALGLPTHFQNDGSILYLLTHATSAPSLHSVRKWVSEEVQPSGSKLIIDTFPRNFRDRTPSESGVAGVQCSVSLENKGAASAEQLSVSIGFSEAEMVIDEIKEDSFLSTLNDLSQLSGTYDKLNLTPLSQIGFRDPASTGCGQQLTIVSLEVQAESRGNLLSNPRFDAINVIALVVQEDTSSRFNKYLLMRGEISESCTRNIDGICDCTALVFDDEKHLLHQFVKIILSADPDVLMGWEVQSSSLGYLSERAGYLGLSLLRSISRTPIYEAKKSIDVSQNPESSSENPESILVDNIHEGAVIEDEWSRTHASGIHVGGRIVLNLWRLLRNEVKLNMYSLEAVAEEVLRRKVPSISHKVLNLWYSSGPGRTRYRCIEYIIERAKLNLLIMNQMDMINRTSELARVFGIDFFSVLSRGSQYRVESMLLRLAHTQNYLAISPGNHQVAMQPAMECLPLVMEPESSFYLDPVVVLDFQSLYPSMIIAYNLCYSTCLGKVLPSKSNVLGVSSYTADPHLLNSLKEQLLLTPNGVAYVPKNVRKGVLPRLLDEILSTRIMVKQAMKKLSSSQHVLERIFNARQLALKLIANVTYGYTAAGFSGRMPCAELADSIVQCGRRTLETSISYVNEHPKWNAKVVYGDTDSMFVLLKGRTLEAAFRIGTEIASEITAINPDPVTLKLEKVYKPCFLLTKKRYVGYSYESPDQVTPTFDAKGIETIRRDTCPAVAKILEKSIRLIFENKDISRVKSYLKRQWTRILSGKVSLQDFIFAKEVRLGNYSMTNSSLPPAAIVALKATNADPRAEVHYGQRVPYVVIHGEPGSRLIDMVIDPHNLLEVNSQYRLNDLYYIKKQINPALQRVLGLLGIDLNQWFMLMPRPVRPTSAKQHSYVLRMASSFNSDDNRLGTSKMYGKRSRIDTYYMSKHCTLCGELVQTTKHLCDKCTANKSIVGAAIVGRTSKLEKDIHHLTAICRHCGGGGDDFIERKIWCTSLACSVYYERLKVLKELQSSCMFAVEEDMYPTCMVEWF